MCNGVAKNLQIVNAQQVHHVVHPLKVVHLKGILSLVVHMYWAKHGTGACTFYILTNTFHQLNHQ